LLVVELENYQKLNKYPIATIEDLLDELNVAIFFSKIVLKCALTE
jgi:hypothetical protein